MGQVERNLDQLIAMLVQREPVELAMDPQGPLNWHQVVLLGTLELGQVPQENWPSISSGAQTYKGTT